MTMVGASFYLAATLALLLALLAGSSHAFRLLPSSSSYPSSSSSSSSFSTSKLSEQPLYRNLYPYTQFKEGYSGGSNDVRSITTQGRFERIDQPVVHLPTEYETRPTIEKSFHHTFPDTVINNRIDNTKEIHSYTVQRRIINQLVRVFHRYMKTLNVNTVYNTNIRRVNHHKLINLLNTVTQETHQPKLLVKYTRTDKLNDLGERAEAPVVENTEQRKELPPVIEPARVERIGYDGQPLSSGAGMNNGAATSWPSSSAASNAAFGTGK